MNRQIWYEVFIDNGIETRTLETFDTLREAEVFKEKYIGKYLQKNPIEALDFRLGIDKWKNIDNPTQIGEII